MRILGPCYKRSCRAVKQAAVYKGPAIIMGDFNILGAAVAMTACQTCKFHTFPAHPALEAHFDFDILVRDRIVWHLPRDSSSLLIDPDTFDSASEASCKKRDSKFERAIAAHSPTDALHCFAVSFDEALAQSSVTTTGEPCPVPRSYLGRCRGPLFRRVRAVGPVLARARQGKYQCTVLQPGHDLRLKVKQVRRLSSLLGLMANLEKQNSRTTAAICEELWAAIRAAKGFSGGFPHWALRNLRIFLPTPLPSRPFVSEIFADLSTLVRTQEQMVRLQECRKFASAMVTAIKVARKLLVRSGSVNPHLCLLLPTRIPFRFAV